MKQHLLPHFLLGYLSITLLLVITNTIPSLYLPFGDDCVRKMNDLAKNESATLPQWKGFQITDSFFTRIGYWCYNYGYYREYPVAYGCTKLAHSVDEVCQDHWVNASLFLITI
jgi:hypothetical protein